MTKIDIFSGFLGAGKTTLIKKLIKEAYTGEQIVLIENEFGEIGIDGGFLQDAGIKITEMNSGCICCSLVGDFSEALKKVEAEYHPDRIVIEPSGVGKLSDVIKAVSNAKLEGAVLNAFCTVVDAGKCKMYMKNFGEFFNDQVENAACIVLSHTDGISEEKLASCVELLREKILPRRLSPHLGNNLTERLFLPPWKRRTLWRQNSNALQSSMKKSKRLAGNTTNITMTTGNVAIMNIITMTRNAVIMDIITPTGNVTITDIVTMMRSAATTNITTMTRSAATTNIITTTRSAATTNITMTTRNVAITDIITMTGNAVTTDIITPTRYLQVGVWKRRISLRKKNWKRRFLCSETRPNTVRCFVQRESSTGQKAGSISTMFRESRTFGQAVRG